MKLSLSLILIIGICFSQEKPYIKKCFIPQIPESIRTIKEDDTQISYIDRIVQYRIKNLYWYCYQDINCMPLHPCSFHASPRYLYEIKFELHLLRKSLKK